jgi:hypothetical protein
MKGASHRSKIRQVKHINRDVPDGKINGSGSCCCFRKLHQLQPVLADMYLHGQVADELAMLF